MIELSHKFRSNQCLKNHIKNIILKICGDTLAYDIGLKHNNQLQPCGHQFTAMSYWIMSYRYMIKKDFSLAAFRLFLHFIFGYEHYH